MVDFFYSPHKKKETPTHKTAHLQTTPADPQTKVCKRAVFLPMHSYNFVTLWGIEMDKLYGFHFLKHEIQG